MRRPLTPLEQETQDIATAALIGRGYALEADRLGLTDERERFDSIVRQFDRTLPKQDTP